MSAWWRKVMPCGVLVFGPRGLVDLAIPMSAVDGLADGDICNDIAIAEHYGARFALGTREGLRMWGAELRAEVAP